MSLKDEEVHIATELSVYKSVWDVDGWGEGRISQDIPALRKAAETELCSLMRNSVTNLSVSLRQERNGECLIQVLVHL